MIEALKQAGFHDVRATQSFDSFRGTNKERVAGKYGVRGTNFIGWR